MTDLYLVLREKDAQEPKGSIHVSAFSQKGPALHAAETNARAHPGVRYVVAKVMDACEAAITPALWDSQPEEEG